MTLRTAPPFRADHVGSFLRPPELLAVRDRFAKVGHAALRAAEDAAIRDIVRFQEEAGLSGITDGEFRRTYFHIDFLEQLQGVAIPASVISTFGMMGPRLYVEQRHHARPRADGRRGD